jgi:hypothetical protein
MSGPTGDLSIQRRITIQVLLFAEPLFLIPFGSLSASKEVTSAASRNRSGRNQFSSYLGSDRPPEKTEGKARSALSLEGTSFPHSLWAQIAGEEAGRLARAAVGTLFPAESLFLIPRLKISGPVKPNDRASRAARRSCAGTTFPHSSNSRRHRPLVVPQPSARSSLRGDSGILAVQKTDGSVLRFLPPAS